MSPVPPVNRTLYCPWFIKVSNRVINELVDVLVGLVIVFQDPGTGSSD